jgi:hypothetical protein
MIIMWSGDSDYIIKLSEERQRQMLGTIILCFIAGVWFGNGIPHFVKGVTKEDYPCGLGNGPVPNFLAGWLAIATTPLFLYLGHASSHPLAAWITAALGVVPIGLFHSWHGAFGKKN